MRPESAPPAPLDRPAEPVALSVQELSVGADASYGHVPIVRDVSLTLHPGETLAVLGESGCGKSTLARAVAGQLDDSVSITGGEVRINGVSFSAAAARARRKMAGPEIGIVFQDSLTSLNPVLTVGNQVAEPFVLHRGMGRKEAAEAAVEMLRRVGIPDPGARARLFPHQLSGGMRQRVLIAIAVALGPSVLIADEPTTALDVTVQAQIMDLLREVQGNGRTALMLITHDVAVAAEEADRIAVMYAGRVVECGRTEDVVFNPRHPYTKALLSSMPSQVAGGGKLRAIPGEPPDLASVSGGCAFAPRCALARPACSEIEPPLVDVQPGHTSACLFWPEVSAS